MPLPAEFVTVRVRARPMAPEDRRDAILDAVTPLIREHGRALTTRQIAQAAGVAEGTIFRVFSDKDELIEAAIARLMDPLPLRTALSGIDRELPLEQRIHEILTHLRARFVGVFGLMSALGLRERPPIPGGEQQEWRRIVAELLEPDRDRLAAPVEDVVAYLRMIAFSSSIPPFTDPAPFTTEQLSALVVRGIAPSTERRS